MTDKTPTPQRRPRGIDWNALFPPVPPDSVTRDVRALHRVPPLVALFGDAAYARVFGVTPAAVRSARVLRGWARCPTPLIQLPQDAAECVREAVGLDPLD